MCRNRMAHSTGARRPHRVCKQHSTKTIGRNDNVSGVTLFSDSVPCPAPPRRSAPHQQDTWNVRPPPAQLVRAVACGSRQKDALPSNSSRAPRLLVSVLANRNVTLKSESFYCKAICDYALMCSAKTAACRAWETQTIHVLRQACKQMQQRPNSTNQREFQRQLLGKLPTATKNTTRHENFTELDNMLCVIIAMFLTIQ